MSDDTLYTKKQKRIVDFAFDEQVASVFGDMLERSIPAYRELIAMLGVFADEYYQKGSVCYDLGCSLGAASFSLANRLQSREQNNTFKIIAVDNSEPMLKRCQSSIKNLSLENNIRTELADINQIDISHASIVVLNFTLQFISIDKRLDLLKKIVQGLNPGGVLILSEKCMFENSNDKEFYEKIYYQYKRANGYSNLEIAQKREALEKVLLAESAETHVQRLKSAGFSSVYRWYQCFQFNSFCAIR